MTRVDQANELFKQINEDMDSFIPVQNSTMIKFSSSYDQIKERRGFIESRQLDF